MSINNVSGADLFSKLPQDLQTKLNAAKAEDRASILADYLKENRKTMEDDVYDGIIAFQKAEGDVEAQRAHAEAEQKRIAETNAAKEAATKAAMASENPAESAVATVQQAKANLEEAQKLAAANPTDENLQAQVAAKENELAAAQKASEALEQGKNTTLEIIQERGVKTNSKGNEVEFTHTTINYDLEAPQRGDDVGKRWTKDDARAEFNRYTNNTGHDFVIKDKNGNVQKIIKPGEEVKGDDLKALKKQVEADYKALEKEYKAELNKEPRDFAKIGILQEQVRVAYEEKETIKGAESSKGIGRITKRHNQNVEANEQLRDTQVFYSKDEEKAAKAAAKAQGQEIKTKVVEPKDLRVVQQLSALAKTKIENAKNDEERAQLEQVWGELRDMCHDKDGNPIQGNPDPDKVKDALTNITGSDRSLDISEMKIVAKETGCSDGDVRHAFRAYGFQTQRPFGRKLTNALKAAVPVAAAEFLGQLLSRNKKTAEAHSEATSRQSAFAESIVTNTEHHDITLTADGKSITYTNPQTGREETLELAGISQDFSFDTSATAKAVAYAEAFASASADAIATAVASAGPAAYLGALIAGAIGFCKTPTEKGVAGAGTEMYKLAQLTSVYKAPQDKKIASQIHQMIGNITGDKAMDAAIIQSVLERDSGDQNTILTTRELEGAYQNLKEIQGRFKNYKPAEVTDVQEPEPPAPPVPPTPPEPEPKPELDLEERTVTVKIPYIKYGGPWHYSQLYVNEDGSALSDADRKAVMKHLQNNHLSVDTKTKQATLDNEIELPNGKKVKLADDAAARAEKMKGKPGGRNVSFVHNEHGEGRVLVDGKPAPGAAGQWQPIEQARDTYNRMKAEQDKQ